MPIKVTCQCGKSFAAKDELAGKAVKCPNCQQPLRIPLAQAAAPLPSRPPSQPATSAAGSLFDEVGLKQAPVGSSMCPGCASPMTLGALICIKCGYNVKLGRRMETVRTGAEVGGPGGHGAATADLMNRAAATMEEDKEEERKKTSAGAPWWVYLIGLIFVIGFIVMMMLLPQRSAMQAGGWLMFSIGTIMCFYSYIRVVIIAFHENIAFGLMTLFTAGCGWLVYCIMRWDRCSGYFFMNIAGSIVQTLGYGSVMLGQTFAEGEPDARINPAPGSSIVVSADPPWAPPLLKL